MNSEERQMITGLFDRMRGVGPMDKDRDAEALINQSVRQMPDSAYMLVQSVLVQENALQQAGSRIEELEERVRMLEEQTARAQPQQSSGGGSFLGGLFGGSKPAQSQPLARGSVPAMGSRPMGAPSMPAGSPWGQQAAQPQGYAQQGQGYGAPMQQAPAQAPAGGGFMKSALTTAAGVAGGMLLADSIRGMMGGHGNSGAAQAASHQNAGNQSASSDAAYDPNATTTDQPAQSAQYQDPNQYEADNYQEAAEAEPEYDDGGDGDGGMDI